VLHKPCQPHEIFDAMAQQLDMHYNYQEEVGSLDTMLNAALKGLADDYRCEQILE